MNKQDMLKIQPCVLRVSIHCDGCKHKVQKQLQKIEGVYKVSIDVDQGKVTVTGNVHPSTLISKLEKSGKHAELWGGGPKGPITIMNNQFRNTQMEKGNFGKDGKGQKGGKGQQKGGGAPKDMNLKNYFKDKKSVKFNLPEEEGYSDEFDEFDPDDDDDSFVDDFDQGFAGHKPPTKAAPVNVQGGKANKAAKDGHQKGKKGSNNGGNEKKGSRIDTFLKGMLGKAGVKTGTAGGNHSKKTDKAKGGDKNGGKGGGGKNPSKGGKNGKPPNKINENWSKNFDGYPKLDNRHPGFNEMRPNPGMMGQMPNFRAMPGLPAGAAMNAGYMNPGYFPGAGQGTNHPQNQQQYMDQMRMMMMMNQQQQQHGNFHVSGYNHPLGGGYMMQQQQHLQHPPMSYGPPLPPHPGNDQYTHMFSDENTGSCSIM